MHIIHAGPHSRGNIVYILDITLWFDCSWAASHTNSKKDKYIQCKLVHCNPNAKLHSYNYKELINWVKTACHSDCLIPALQKISTAKHQQRQPCSFHQLFSFLTSFKLITAGPNIEGGAHIYYWRNTHSLSPFLITPLRKMMTSQCNIFSIVLQ